MAWYDPPDWRLTSVSYMHVAREAEIHAMDGVEIEMLDWEASNPAWRTSYTHYARLTEENVQWLATRHVRNGKTILYTFLDDGFDADWGESSRRFEDTGRLAANDDGSYTLVRPPGKALHDVFGAGMFRVGIGRRRFTCLRVIELIAKARTRRSLEREILSECYYTRRGRLVLFRRCNGRLWAAKGKGSCAGPPWDERFPDNARLVINGAVFVHWYDCLTDIGCGIGA
jgi:hypothetical protein